MPGFAASPSCTDALGSAAVAAGPLQVLGTQTTAVDLALAPGHVYLIQVDERDNDVLVEIADTGGKIIGRADHPERRTGSQRAIVTMPESRALVVRATGKEHANAVGTVGVRAFDLAAMAGRPDCIAVLNTLAEADAAYAAAGEISRGGNTSGTSGAHEAFLKAADGYRAAQSALTAPADRALRGETQLALASVEYLDLQNWEQTAQWAQVAAETLGDEDRYRRARAQALLAGAWIEVSSAARSEAGSGKQADPGQLLTRARNLLKSLNDFHLERGERYDAGLQVTNISLTYLYQGRYPECVTAARTSARVFDALHETTRRAQAWQNRALCLWGLGRLPEALRWFERALPDIGPTPYPTLYVTVIANTALVNYALGRFDESLRLYDRALGFVQKVPAPRDEAYCLYGVGVNYYALGDAERARHFLERSLELRTVALDSRGRMSTLQALATIAAEQGHVNEALSFDRAALSLAVAPSAVARIRIQLAMHTAAAGQVAEAKTQLDQVLANRASADPLIQAEALLRRATLLRGLGRPREALSDLAAARPRLRALGSATGVFAADLDLARTLRLVGKTRAAQAAVDRALSQADAVRLQSANPDLRAQLQAPLRPAYELKLELLREDYEGAMAAGHVESASRIAADAFAKADESRAHSFADVAAQRYSPELREALAGVLSRREGLYRELSARRFALDARLNSSGSSDPRARHLLAEIAELERQLDAVNTVIAARTLPRAARGGSVSARARLPSLPAGTALVSYWLGSDAAYVWVVLPSGISWIRLSASDAIAAQAEAFHRSLSRFVDVPAEERLRNAASVYGMIIRPIEPQLSGARRWLIIPDGALAYVPFAALRTADGKGGVFVAAQHDVALTPAAWTLSMPRPPARHQQERLLLVADPVYQSDDPRLAGIPHATASARPAKDTDLGRSDYQRLPFTAREAAQISTQFPSGAVDQLLGFNATRERLLALDWSRYQFIHIATHGVVDAQVPQLSALILGSYDSHGARVDGELRVADLSLQTLTADVAVFSACDTALGKNMRGEGIVGIGSIVLARGARAVVASLWPVSDEMSARLMTTFYQHLLHDSSSAPAALGAAMRSALSGDGVADPALWGAFQVSVSGFDASARPAATPAVARINRPWPTARARALSAVAEECIAGCSQTPRGRAHQPGGG